MQFTMCKTTESQLFLKKYCLLHEIQAVKVAILNFCHLTSCLRACLAYDVTRGGCIAMEYEDLNEDLSKL